MGDESRTCIICGRTFTWSYSEQRTYRDRKLDPPKRCSNCRETRTALRSESPTREARVSTPAERDRRWEEARTHAQDAYDRLHPQTPLDAPQRPSGAPPQAPQTPVSMWLVLTCVGVGVLIVIVLYLLLNMR
jgi:hypothetical protein